MRNRCIGFAVVALAFTLWFLLVNENEAAYLSWGVGCWVMLSLALGFHEAAKS